MSRQRPLAHRQRGVATVFIAMVLLLAMALIALYTSRSAIVEQRVSANEVRAKQALSVAMAGIDHALAQLRDNGMNVANVQGDLVSGGITSSYRTVFAPAPTASAPAIPACPATPGFPAAASAPTGDPILLAVSCGWSDDNASVQRVAQLLERRPPFSGPPSVPLVTKGGIALGGNPAVFNYFNDLTVWSGETLDKNGSPSSTFIRDIADPDHAQVDPDFTFREIGNGSGTPDGYFASTTNHANTLKLGHDMVGGDSTLRDKTPAQFFELFMGMPPAAYRATVPDHVVTSLGAVASPNGKVIWVDAVGGASVKIPGNLGTQAEPVVLVVNGNLEVAGNTVINGLVFVLGDVEKMNGGVTIYGGLISSGKFDGGGTPSIVYDPYLLTTAKNTLGNANKVGGTWRDW